MNEAFLSDFRDQVKAFTEADPYFADIPILNERLKDLNAAIESKLAILGGICIVLVTPSLGGVLKGTPGANFKDIKIIGRVLENTLLNDTGKEALDVAVYLHCLWNGPSKPDTMSGSLTPDDQSIALANDPKYLSYDVRFSSSGGTALELPRLAIPTITAADRTAIALAHATPGAAIFYTTDGTPPIPRNPSASLYLAPFAALPDLTIRARAWLAGYLPSPTLTL